MEENFETTDFKPKDFPNIIILGSRRAFHTLDIRHCSFSGGEKVEK